MTSLKQIAANRLNALKSTGPRTADGKQRSRQNALRHGLTAETVVTALEHAADYQALEASIMADYQPRTATERELVARLASVLWRLRRATSIETGLFQIQGELLRKQHAAHLRRRTVPPPQWYDELDAVPTIDGYAIAPRDPDPTTEAPLDPSEMLADCFLQVSRLGYGAFDLLNRYEAALWRTGRAAPLHPAVSRPALGRGPDSADTNWLCFVEQGAQLRGLHPIPAW